MRLYQVIGMPVLMSVVILAFMMNYTAVGVEYDVNYTNTSMQNIINTSQEFKTTAEDFEEKDENRFSSVTDDLEGSLFNQALKSLDVVKNSISSFGKIIAETVGMVGIGDNEFASFLIGILTSLVLIAILLGIFTKALFKITL